MLNTYISKLMLFLGWDHHHYHHHLQQQHIHICSSIIIIFSIIICNSASALIQQLHNQQHDQNVEGTLLACLSSVHLISYYHWVNAATAGSSNRAGHCPGKNNRSVNIISDTDWSDIMYRLRIWSGLTFVSDDKCLVLSPGVIEKGPGWLERGRVDSVITWPYGVIVLCKGLWKGVKGGVV